MIVNDWRKLTVIIDSNLLLVYFIGCFRVDLLGSFKRTEKYDEDDFEVLRNILDQARNVMITPNIVTELSNLVSELGENTRIEFFNFFKSSFMVFHEEYVESAIATNWKYFSKFGITDSVIAVAASSRPCLVVTDDYKLVNILYKEKILCMNLNTIKGLPDFRIGIK